MLQVRNLLDVLDRRELKAPVTGKGLPVHVLPAANRFGDPPRKGSAIPFRLVVVLAADAGYRRDPDRRALRSFCHLIAAPLLNCRLAGKHRSR